MTVAAEASDPAAAPPPAAGPFALPRRLLGNDTGIVAATVVLLNLLRIVSSMILTRLLAPGIFGTVGVITSIMFVLTMMSDLGFQAFVVRHRDGERADFLDAIWTIRLGRAIALTLILAAVASPVAGAIGKPAIAPLLAVAGVQFAIEGLSSLSLVTALREGRVARLSLLELLVALGQLAAGVALAMAWRSAWSMVAAMLVASAAKTWLSYALFPRSRRRWRIERARAGELWRFARFVTGSSVITMILMQADKLVLSRVLTLEAFGLYVLAGNLALAPLSFVSSYAARVLYPLYARTWREAPERLAGVYYAARRRVSLLYMFGAGGLIGVAPLVVALLYDARYEGAAVYLRLLALAPLLALASAAANEALTASGHVRATFHASIAKLAWLAVAGPAAFLLAGPIGLVAVVGAIEAPTLLYTWVCLWRVGLLDVREEAALVAAAAVGAPVGLAADLLVRPLIA